MLDEKKLAESMQAVMKAHAILLGFHREVTAFFEIMDELLAPEGGPTRLAPEKESDVVAANPKFKRAAPLDWVPRWFGRFYYDLDAYPEGDDEDGATFVKLAMAFVWIVASPTNTLLPGATGPECIAGIAHPGLEGQARSFWDGAYYGVWQKLPTAQLVTKDWKEGKFDEMTTKFGKKAVWRARRFPLVNLPSREVIETKVAKPLLEEFAAKFKKG